MSARSKSSSSSIQSNGSTSTPSNNYVRSTQPLIARPYSSTIASNRNSSNRSNQSVYNSQPSKKSTVSVKKNQSHAQNSSLSMNSPSHINYNRVSRTALNRHRGSSSFGIKSYINDPTCISLRQQLIDCDDPSEIYDQIEDAQLQKLVTHLKEYEQDNALSENYIEASKSRNLSLEIHEILKIRKKNEINESFFTTSQAITRNTTTTTDNHQKWNMEKQEEEEFDASYLYSNDGNSNMNDLNDNEIIMSNQIKEFDQFYQDKIEKYQEETTKKINKLNECHKQQIIILEKKWKEKKPAQYRKPSANLLQLKTIEKNLAMTGDYERAMILHKETESLTRKEMDDAQKRLVYDYKFAKSKLLQKQNSELNQLQQSRQEGLIMLQNQHKLKRQQYENRDKVLQQQKNALSTKRLNQATQSLTLPAPIMTEKLGSVQYNLLPKLIPPNDTNFVKKEERKTREDNKRKRELQKKNIEAISQIYKCRNEYENIMEGDAQNGDQNIIIDKNTEKESKFENDDNNETKPEPESKKSGNFGSEVENGEEKLVIDITDSIKFEEETYNSRSETEENRKEETPNEKETEAKSEVEARMHKLETEEDGKEKASEEEEAKSKSEVEANIPKSETEEDNKSLKSEEEANVSKSETEEERKEKTSEEEAKSKSEVEANMPKSETEEDNKSLKSEEEANVSKSETEEDNKSLKSEEEANVSKSETEEDKKEKTLEDDKNKDSISQTEEDKKEELPEGKETESKSEVEASMPKSEAEEDKKSIKSEAEEDKKLIKSEEEANKQEEQKEISVSDQANSISVENKETDESKEENKQEETDKSKEENKETKSESEAANKTALDISLISSLIGSANPKGHESTDEEVK